MVEILRIDQDEEEETEEETAAPDEGEWSGAEDTDAAQSGTEY